LYFTPEDALTEARQIPNARFRPIPSIWGHRAGNPAKHRTDELFIRNAVAELLDDEPFAPASKQ
jgi:homoserine O-acetyltransferase